LSVDNVEKKLYVLYWLKSVLGSALEKVLGDEAQPVTSNAKIAINVRLILIIISDSPD
jgi:hypothetical protein